MLFNVFSPIIETSNDGDDKYVLSVICKYL